MTGLPADYPPTLVAALLRAASESRSGTFVVHVGETPTRLPMLRGALLLVGEEAYSEALVCIAARNAEWTFEGSVDAFSLTNGTPITLEALLRAAAARPRPVAPTTRSLIVATPSQAIAAAALKRLHDGVKNRHAAQSQLPPLHEDASKLGHCPCPDEPPRSSPAASMPKKRVVVVEDDATTLAMMRRALSTSFEVAEARTGIDALALLGAPPLPAVLLLDVMLPGVDGVTVARRVRAESRLKDVPIVFVSAKTSPADVLLGIGAGAKHYLTKPFSVAALLDLVERLAR